MADKDQAKKKRSLMLSLNFDELKLSI